MERTPLEDGKLQRRVKCAKHADGSPLDHPSQGSGQPL